MIKLTIKYLFKENAMSNDEIVQQNFRETAGYLSLVDFLSKK